MAGRRCYVLAAAVGFATAPLYAQAPTKIEGADKPVEPRRNGWFGAKKKAERAAANSPEFDNVRKAIDALTPEQRKRFQENFQRWINLSPDEKRTMRDRDEARRKQISDEIDAAVTQSGLQLEGERRARFAKRYAEERRRVEMQLRRESEEKRKPLVQDIIGRLTAEFSEGALTPAPAAAINPQ